MKNGDTKFYGKVRFLTRKWIAHDLKERFENMANEADIYDKPEGFRNEVLKESVKIIEEILKSNSVCKAYAIGYYEVADNYDGDTEYIDDSFCDYDEEFLHKNEKIKLLLKKISDCPDKEEEARLAFTWGSVSDLWGEYCRATPEANRMTYVKWLEVTFHVPVKK